MIDLFNYGRYSLMVQKSAVATPDGKKPKEEDSLMVQVFYNVQ